VSILAALKMKEFFGFPKDMWSKLVLLNEEDTELDWNLQKRNGTFKLSVFWKPILTDERVGSQASNKSSRVKQQTALRINRERETRAQTLGKPQHPIKQDLHKTNVKKHKSPSVLRRDQARLEKWRARWQPAEQSTTSTQVQKLQHHPEHNQTSALLSTDSTSPVAKAEEPEQKQTMEETSGGRQQENSVLSDAGKKAGNTDAADDQKKLILASLERLQDLQTNSSLCEEISGVSPEQPAIDSRREQQHSLESVLRVSCFTCNKPESEVAGGLKLCTRCRGASYCSRQCQITDWGVHKPICSPAKTSIIEKITSSLQQELKFLSN